MQNGFARVAVIIAVTVVLAGVLGYVGWANFINKDASLPGASLFGLNDDGKTSDPCGGINGSVFCSTEVGIKLDVPKIFENQFKRGDNYEVYKGPLDYEKQTAAGKSDVVFEASSRSEDTFTLVIAKEPLRSGYIGIGHKLQNTYFDEKTGQLTTVVAPTSSYDSSTDTTTTTGEYKVGDVLPSFMVGEVKVYHGSIADAGARIESYLAVINGSIIKIKLSHYANIGPSEGEKQSTDSDRVFNELDASVKKLELVK